MNTNPDRLYELLPVIYRMRDAEQAYPLRALLRVIGEQVDVVENDMAQLYENWFIETAESWVVPYIADLIGYRPVHEAGEPGDPNTPRGSARNKILIPRREVANTLHYRRRKGALALLEALANDVAGWNARAVEFFKLLGWTQNLNHQHLDRARTVDVRDGNALALLDGPFERLAHTVDVRRPNSARTRGRYNIPSVGLFVWRLNAYSVTDTPAYCVEEVGPHNYTFSVLGNDAPLFTHPERETDPTHIADELNVPAPIRRRAFELFNADGTSKHEANPAYYGAGKSLLVWASQWGKFGDEPIPPEYIIPADLTDWQYYPQRDHIAVDPELGRLAFPPAQLPKKGVRVFYHYGFSAAMGGGEYDRPIIQAAESVIYRVGENERYKQIGDALREWMRVKANHQPKAAVIEIADSGVYIESLNFELDQDETLQLRAANRKRPVIRLIDWHTDLPDALSVSLDNGSRFILDGLLITGRAVHVRAKSDSPPIGVAAPNADSSAATDCAAEVIIRHCTLVPGWGLQNDCEPRRPAEPSLEIFNVNAQVRIEHSIVGSIQVHLDQVRADPIPLHISDSILDATSSEREAIGAPGRPVAHVVLTAQRCTVFGIVQVHAMELGENSIFNDCVNVARRQLGCMRFCYVPPGCRTPRCYHCQPDMVEAAVRERFPSNETTRDRLSALEQTRVRPQFTDRRYGRPGYGQLAETCAVEIKRGADDESEMGAFHDLFQPQREANLRARLDEYTPAGANVGIFFAS
ncbi:MAG: hypothetical protein EYC68_18010 [Chloroflexota bacterium]|nr:MAG: hypothetical protein EYC68_18010 [Chloroflexota bacterium]